MIGELVGSYRIVDQIAVGGMGIVFRAEHTLIGRVVAVKILHPELSGNRDVINRFFNEAKATTTIKHPGIVEVFDFGYLENGNAYLVMEYLEGEPLADRIHKQGPMSEGNAAVLMRSVCSALAAAHAKGIVHRDLKPDNIFVVPDADSAAERTKILDFGIAKLTDVGLAGSTTKTGAVMGTPTYMSPEQCSGKGNVDHRADLYSIGCILYELVAGRPPFVSEGAGELIGSHLYVEPEPLSKYATVSPDYEQLTMTLLRKDPAQRVQAAAALGSHLGRIARQHGHSLVNTDPYAPMLTDPSLGSQPTPVPLLTPLPPLQTPTPQPLRASTPAPVMTPLPRAPTPAPIPTPMPVATTQSGATKSTTLTGATGEMATVSGPRKRLFLAIGGGLLAAGIGIAVFLAVAPSSAPQAATQPENASPSEPKASTEPTPNVVPSNPPVADPPAEPVEPDKPPIEVGSAEGSAAVVAKPTEPVTKPKSSSSSKKPKKKPAKTTKPDQTPATKPELLETSIE